MSKWTATVTNKGYALQAKLLSTDKLNITRVVSGSGSCAVTQLINQTAVADIKQALTVDGVYYDNFGNARIKTTLSNTDLTTGYDVNQIGIYATDPDEGEILYAIAQADKAEPVPSISEQPNGFYCSWDFSLTYSNAQNVSVTIDPSQSLTVEAGDRRYLREETAEEVFLQKEDAVGRNVEGETFQTDADGTTAKAREGAEIFNDYRDRHYDYKSETTYFIEGNVATGKNSTAKGEGTTATGDYSFASGYNTAAKGSGAFATGYYNEAQANTSFACGNGNNAIGIGSFACGWQNNAKGMYSFVSGNGNNANGMLAFVSGYQTVANDVQFVAGKYNIEKPGVSKVDNQSSSENLFMVGWGTSTTRDNALRIDGTGKCYGESSFGGSNADFAEYFEWSDGNPNNEDRRGLIVTLDGNKIRPATAEDDYILGVITATGAFIGNLANEHWQDKYVTDVFGERITQQVEIPEKVDENTGETIPAHTVTQFVVNPDYDPDKEYVSREFRQEWNAVGMLGQVVVVDDGSCLVNGYCTPSVNGIGTAGDKGYRVMERLDDTHIRVLVR